MFIYRHAFKYVYIYTNLHLHSICKKDKKVDRHYFSRILPFCLFEDYDEYIYLGIIWVNDNISLT